MIKMFISCSSRSTDLRQHAAYSLRESGLGPRSGRNGTHDIDPSGSGKTGCGSGPGLVSGVCPLTRPTLLGRRRWLEQAFSSG